MKSNLRFHLLALIALAFYFPASGQVLDPLGHGVRTIGTIATMAYDSTTGYIYAGGNFENIGGLETPNIAMYNGSQWVSMGGGINGYVSSICVINSQVYAGGSFTSAGGVQVHNVARWDGSQWYPLGNNPVTYYTVMSLASWNGKLVLSAFLAAPFGPSTGMIEWDGNAWSLIATTTTTNATIFLYSSDSALFAYGRFTDLNGQSVINVARFDPGGILTPVSTAPNITSVRTITNYNNVLYAVNNLGTLAHYVSGTGWVNDNVTCGTKTTKLFVYTDSLYISMEKNSIGTYDTLEIWNVYNGSFYRKIANNVSRSQNYETIECVLPVGDTLYIGGVVSKFNNSPIPSSAFFDGSQWKVFGGAAVAYGDAWTNASVSSIAYDSLNQQLYVAGSFIFAGDTISYNVARWDGIKWHPVGNGLNNFVYKLLYYNDTLYACGSFTASGIDSVKYLAKWNGSAWVTAGAGLNGTVVDMIVYNNVLYAGGAFTLSNGTGVGRMVKYNGSAWSPVGNNVLDATVYGMVIYNNSLLAHSNFSFNFDWPNSSSIAQLSGSTWNLFNEPPDYPDDLYVFNNQLYLTSTGFTTQWTDLVYELVNNSWTLTNFMNNSSSGATMLTIDNKLVINANNDRTYYKSGSGWPVLFNDLRVKECVTMANGDLILGGFFPWVFDGIDYRYYYNIGKFTLGPPVANYTQDADTICDHQYVQYTAPYSSIPSTYEWQFPGGIPSSSTLQFPIVKYNSPGSYDVFFKATSSYGTDSILAPNSVMVLNCSVGIPINDALPAVVYPNPASDRIFIRSENSISEYSVSSLSGVNFILENSFDNEKEITIDVSNLKPGIYLIRVVSSGSSTVRKVVITKP